MAAAETVAIAERVSAYVRERRRALGWTQADLALRAGLHPNRVSEVERALAARLTVETVVALANALGATVPDLIGQPSPRSLDTIHPAEERLLRALRADFTPKAP